MAVSKSTLGSKRSAISLHEQQVPGQSSANPPFEPYTDLEPEDSPPAYTGIGQESPSSSVPERGNLWWDPDLNQDSLYNHVPESRIIESSRRNESYTISLAQHLSTNWKALYGIMVIQSKLPPRIAVLVKGTHTVNSKNRGKDSSKQTVTDFEFRVDASDVIMSPTQTNEGDHFDGRWRVLNVVHDNDHLPAYRGGRFKSKVASGWESAQPIVDVEQQEDSDVHAEAQNDLDGLKTWCQRFCGDKSGVKSFTLHREISDWNFKYVKQEITSVLRSTDYRGKIEVSLFTGHSRLTIHSPSRINRLRTNSFVWWMCVILQLWIFTWPLLILLEKRYEIVKATYYAKRVGEFLSPLGSEVSWVEGFAPAIKAAALGRRTDNELITFSDLRRLREEGGRPSQESAAERERRERMNSGEANWSDTLVGVVRGVSEVRSQLNLNSGWGGNQ